MSPIPTNNLRCRVVICLGLLLAPFSIEACGWWGDAEKSDSNEAVIVRPDGFPELTDLQSTDADYLVSLGNQYRSVINPAHNFQIAVHFYSQAAELNHPGAQYNLGLMYELGLGVTTSQSRAAGWYRLAAEQNNVDAQHHLGELYLSGAGVNLDHAVGLEWLEKSAQNGHADIYLRLGQLYWKNWALEESLIRAALWAQMAFKQGDQSAQDLLREIEARLSLQQKQEVGRLVSQLQR